MKTFAVVPWTTTVPSDENRRISYPAVDGGSGNTNSRASIAPKTAAIDPKFQSSAFFSHLFSIGPARRNSAEFDHLGSAVMNSGARERAGRQHVELCDRALADVADPHVAGRA